MDGQLDGRHFKLVIIAGSLAHRILQNSQNCQHSDPSEICYVMLFFTMDDEDPFTVKLIHSYLNEM